MWAYCTEGHRHWGTRGAAGLLLTDAGRVLLQLRSARVQLGGTWSVPGGAREPGETFEDAALREAREEIGLDPARVELVDLHTAFCGGWPYLTLIGHTPTAVRLRGNAETARLEWVHVSRVASLPLHPAFADAWTTGLKELVA